MFDTKFIATLGALAIAVFAVCNIKNKVKENFLVGTSLHKKVLNTGGKNIRLGSSRSANMGIGAAVQDVKNHQNYMDMVFEDPDTMRVAKEKMVTVEKEVVDLLDDVYKYERAITVAPNKSRNLGQGDWLRGDLQFEECADSAPNGWFRPSQMANKEANLQVGYFARHENLGQ